MKHSQHGLGTVLESHGDELKIQFPDGETRSFMLINSLLDGQLFIDSPEFQKKLRLSSANMKHGIEMVQLLEEANRRMKELESGEVSKERLIELLPPLEIIKDFPI